jgi:hypothetical protein
MPLSRFVSLFPAMTALRAVPDQFPGRFLCPQTLHVIGILLRSPQPTQPEWNQHTLKAQGITGRTTRTRPPSLDESNRNLLPDTCF